MKAFSKKLPIGFKLVNLIILIPALLWPLIFFVSIFMFDNPSNFVITIIIFFVINAYPLYLLVLLELNARVFIRWGKVGYILPVLILIAMTFLVMKEFL